eukprot:m51a1_g4314 hypothetical protein (504) ;mRNA; f:45474-48975
MSTRTDRIFAALQGPVLGVSSPVVHMYKTYTAELLLPRRWRLARGLSITDVFAALQLACARADASRSSPPLHCGRCGGVLAVGDAWADPTGLPDDLESYCAEVRSVCTSSRRHLRTEALVMTVDIGGALVCSGWFAVFARRPGRYKQIRRARRAAAEASELSLSSSPPPLPSSSPSALSMWSASSSAAASLQLSPSSPSPSPSPEQAAAVALTGSPVTADLALSCPLMLVVEVLRPISVEVPPGSSSLVAGVVDKSAPTSVRAGRCAGGPSSPSTSAPTSAGSSSSSLSQAKTMTHARVDKYVVDQTLNADKKHKTALSQAYARGDIPCHINHGCVRATVQWSQAPQCLDYDPLLLFLVEGLIELEHPYVFLAREGVKDLLAAPGGREKTLPLVGRVCASLRVPLRHQNLDIFLAGANALHQLVRCVGAPAVLPHFEPLIAPLRTKLSAVGASRAPAPGGTKGENTVGPAQCMQACNEVLRAVADGGGQPALAMIKSKIPTFM